MRKRASFLLPLCPLFNILVVSTVPWLIICLCYEPSQNTRSYSYPICLSSFRYSLSNKNPTSQRWSGLFDLPGRGKKTRGSWGLGLGLGPLLKEKYKLLFFSFGTRLMIAFFLLTTVLLQPSSNPFFFSIPTFDRYATRC